MYKEPFDPLKTAAMRLSGAGGEGRAARSVSRRDGTSAEGEGYQAALLAGIAEEAPLSGSAGRPLSVREANGLVSRVLTEALPATFHIQGEISNFRVYDRGHAFFTLKEAGAELPCVFWKDGLAALKFRPKDGMAVVARGALKLYEAQGKLQLYVSGMIPRGAGALELAFRQLCEKLRAEGLFEGARKRRIPALPERIAIITSRTGDVLHDVLTTAHRRYPGLHAMLYPVRVQGEEAAREIADAIEALNRAPHLRIDLILLVRGGGSLEDLWAFNEELLARAMIASHIPIATGIGHEPDTTIADLVGDLRGPTPTGVTELTIPDVRSICARLEARGVLLTRDLRRMLQTATATLERDQTALDAAISAALQRRQARLESLRRHVEQIEPRHAVAQGWRCVEDGRRRLDRGLQTSLHRSKEALHRLEARLHRVLPLARVDRQRDRVERLAVQMQGALRRRFAAARAKTDALDVHLRGISPQAVLERGYSITTDAVGNIIRTKEQVRKGDLLTTRVADGTIQSTVGRPKQAALF